MTRNYTVVRRTSCAVCGRGDARWMCDTCGVSVCTSCDHTCTKPCRYCLQVGGHTADCPVIS